MSRLTLYLGGPVNGRLERVDVAGPHVEVVHYPPNVAFFNAANELADVQYTRHVYRLRQAFGRQFALSRSLWGLTDDEVMHRLVHGYAEQSATIARHAREYGI